MNTVEKKYANAGGLTPLETNIVNLLENVCNEVLALPKNKKNGALYTQRIKEEMANLGKKQNYEVNSTLEGREVLYDLDWVKRDATGALESVELAFESELSDRKPLGLQDDFDKLLYTNAALRVMFCHSTGGSDAVSAVNKQIELFNRLAGSYKNLAKGSRILIVIWEDYITGDFVPHIIEK